MSHRTLALLGASGSIGGSTLAVVAAHPGQLRVASLGARSNWRALVAPTRAHRVGVIALADPRAAAEARASGEFPAGTRILEGEAGMTEAACLPEVDTVVSAIVGTGGLRPTLAAIRSGKSIALASKEILVLAGKAVTAEARARGVSLLPVDSEHNALHQLLRGKSRDEVARLILTASGGPFRTRPLAELGDVTPEDALRHPNWSMGPKITVDSATMANKGLELIEARWLFDLPAERLGVVIHPQSIIHALVELSDGTLQAQLSPPSMAYPIQDALLYPARPPCPAPRLDLSQAIGLELLPPDESRYPLLGLARAAAAAGGTLPAAFNAANEVAVEAFLARRLRFTGIAKVVESVLAGTKAGDDSLDAALAADADARRRATATLESLSR
jgi:1-deoxy-D-xylulose-5-phosphate reductoisomerase